MRDYQFLKYKIEFFLLFYVCVALFFVAMLSFKDSNRKNREYVFSSLAVMNSFFEKRILQRGDLKNCIILQSYDYDRMNYVYR